MTFTEEHACATCEHQMFDHGPYGCKVVRSNMQPCDCGEFAFKGEPLAEC